MLHAERASLSKSVYRRVSPEVLRSLGATRGLGSAFFDSFCSSPLHAQKVTELCTGGELFDRILEKTESDEGRYSERDAMTLVTKIISAIAYCHDEHNICHRFV